MNIVILNSYDEISTKASEIIIQELGLNSNLLLCTATGGSPTKTYQLLGEEKEKNPKLFNRLRVVKLDEWGGVSQENKGTCESYLQKHVLRPLQIGDNRYLGFNTNPENPQKECDRIQQKLNDEGPIDLCILGIGSNGHLAFNEPDEFLQPFCHVAKLSVKTLEHKMTNFMEFKPKYGLTLGMANILQSKKIVILVTGKGKSQIVQKFLNEGINTQLPASFLWLHHNVTCLIDAGVEEINTYN